MGRVLIVEPAEVFAQIIAESCFTGCEVRFCADGNTALAELEAWHPELLLIDLTLPYKDGLTVLREAAFLPPRILVISYLSDPYLMYTLGTLGVGYVLTMPTPRGVRQALDYLQNDPSGVRADLRSAVVEHLHRLRIPEDLDGYRMLVLGLPVFLQDPEQALGKELYPAIVRAMGSGNVKTVEHSIRHAIHTAWERRDDSVWCQYFARNSRGQIPRPTVKKFLACLLGRLQQSQP